MEQLEPRVLLSLSTTDLISLTATQLAQSLVGTGVTISNASFTGANVAAGSFTGGLSEGLGIDSGVILSSGDISYAAGPNDSDGAGTGNGESGDANLDALIGETTYDAAVLEFDFVPTQSTLSFQYIFASEEYNEYVDSYNDVFAFFVNGQNIAKVPGTSDPVSIDNINNGDSSKYYRDNDYGDFSGNSPYTIQYDGFTTPLNAVANVTAGQSTHIKLVIADAKDSILDSAVFLAGGSFVSGQADVSIVKTASKSSVSSGQAFSYTLTATNNSTATAATGVVVSDILPDEVNYVSASSSQGTLNVTSGGTLTASLGTLAAGASATIIINATAATSGTIVNEAIITANEYDANLNNNASTLTLNSGSSNPISGVKFIDLNGNGVRDGGLIQGTQPDAVFVIDISGSTTGSFKGTPVGDLNNDGSANTILDAEIAAFIALNNQLIAQGFGSTGKVAIVSFSSSAANLDMDPVTAGSQIYINPSAGLDANGAGTSYVEQALRSLHSTGGTNYEPALQKAKDSITAMGTSAANGNVIFLSDGEPNTQNYADDVTTLKATGANVRAFGVGTGATLATLQTIDTGAQIFTSTNELLNVFSGAGTGGGTSYTEPGMGGVTIYLDTNNSGSWNSGEPFTVTAGDGSFSFTGLTAGQTYIVRELVPAGYTQTSGPFTIVLGQTPSTNLEIGNEPITTTAEPYTISGWKFNDLDGDGFRDPDEPGLENWEIFLDDNGNGVLDDGEEYTLTDEDGYFEFTGLDDGTFHIAEVIQTNWVQTYPGSPSFPAWHTVTLSDANNWLYVTDLLFGNHETASTETVTGTKFNDLNGNGVRDGGLIQGSDPDAVFIIDISGSTTSTFIGTPVGDLNGSGGANTILDAEIAGFIALNEQLITQGFGNTARVAIVAFSSSASNLDMDPVAAGAQNYTTPLADKNSNGIKDVEEVLKGLTSTGATDYQDAFQKAITAYTAIGSGSGNGNVIFLSDGVPNDPGSDASYYTDEVATLKNAGANVRAFGVGSGAKLPPLQQIDAVAQIFTSTNELLNVFSGAGTGTGGGTTYTEPGISGVVVYIDENNNGKRDTGEPYQFTGVDGAYSFTGLEESETYIIREEVPAGYVQTSGPYVVTIGEDSTSNLNIGNMVQEVGHPDLLAKSLAFTGGPIVVPGDKLTLSFIISNVGTETASGPVNLYFYASMDGTLDSGDTLMGSLTNQKIDLDPGEDSKAYVLKNYVIPPTMLPDDMTLFAKVEAADSSIDETNLTNNVTSTDMNVRWRFGSWDNDGDGVLDRKNVKLTVNDALGVTCTFTMGGEGYGELDGPNFNLMTLNNSTLKSKVAIKTTGGSPTIQDITCDGDLGDLKASTTNLGDSFSSVGTVASLLMNNAIANGKQIPISIGPAIGAGKPGKIGFHQIKNVTFSSQSDLASLTVAEWLDDDITADTILAPSINKLETKGDTKGGLEGNYMADATLTDGGSTMSALTVNGLMKGSVRTAGSIKAVKLGAAVDSRIFAGISGSVSGLPTGMGQVTNSSASIGSVKMAGKKTIAQIGGSSYSSYGNHSYANTNISAPTMGSIALVGVQRSNGGVDHGLAGDTFKSIKVTQPDKKSYSWDAKNNTWKTSPPETWGDFTVNIL